MKNISLALMLLFTIQGLTAQTGQHSITVNISNIDSVKGNLIIGLYDSESNFLKKNISGILKKITAHTATVTFNNIKAGPYAISLFHDENENKKLDTYLFGIPKEDYGCSNNARGRMGPPKWKDAVFMVNNEDVTQNIKL